MKSAMTATIGDRSSGPTDGRTRRKMPDVRLADVVEEPLHAVERVRHPDPGREDVGEDQEDVDPDEHVDEPLHVRGGVGKHGKQRRQSPQAGFRRSGSFPAGGRDRRACARLALRLGERSIRRAP